MFMLEKSTSRFPVNIGMKPDDLIDEKKIIRTKCMDAEIFAPLYRGVNNKPTVPFIGQIRTDRKPRDSGILLTTIFDMYMETLGYPHRKANTLSLTVDEEQAESYGAVYRVYPFDGCQYVYSKVHDDLIRVPKGILHAYRSSPYGVKLAEQLNTTIDDMIDLGIRYRKGEFTLEDMHLQEFLTRYASQLKHVTGIQRTYRLGQISGVYGEIIVYGKEYLAVPTESR